MLRILSKARRHSPERAVQRARELGRIRHERAAVRKPSIHERALHRAYAAVHHVARRDAVRTRLRVRDSNLGDPRDRWLSVDRSIVVQDAAVPVGGILAEANIRRDVEGRVQLTEELDCEDDRSLRVVCWRPTWVLKAADKVAGTRSAKGRKPGHTRRTFSQVSGTPNRITLLRPFCTRGPRNPSSLFTPQRRCPGRLAISTLASGSSVMKIGYMSIPFVSDRSACQERERGCWYPPWRMDDISIVDAIVAVSKPGTRNGR